VLGEAVSEVGGPQVRNIGTIGGNLSNGVTSADSASTLLAYDALLEYRGPAGTRMVPITEHYVSAGKTRLAHDELLIAIHVPKDSWEKTPGCYIKYAMRNAMDIATLGCSVNVRMEGKNISRLRIAFGVAGPIPMRAPTAEKLAQGKELTPELVEAVGAAVLEDINPRDSWRASKFLRQQVAKELTKRALMAAVTRKPQKGSKVAPPLVRETMPAECLPDGFVLIKCTINGKPRETVVDARASLTDLLRNDYRLTSVKKGCEVGECGACNVVIDNECFNSCIYLAAWANGKSITTTEGLTHADGTLSALQQIFVEEGAVQCGFCTPGFLLSANELIERAKAGETWTDTQLRKELSGHLCRCTGYVNIVKAVRRAISESTGECTSAKAAL
jgi:xanthine dehydrogenase iron-sulfur cluster and FAD-binding subunit A